MPDLDRDRLAKLPKVELHRHLDGSVRFETLVDLAQRHRIDLGTSNYHELEKRTKIRRPMSSLQEVLDSFWTTQKVLCRYEAIKRITLENVEDCFLDGVKLVELRFAPTFIQQNKSDLAYDEVIEGVLDGALEGRKKFGIAVGLIHIIPRSLPARENERATAEIIRYKRGQHAGHDLLVGIDLADSESTTRPEDFVSMIDAGRDAGLGITIHSGEDTSALHMWKALEIYRPRRFGHGIRAIDDPALMRRLKEDGVHLEVCPTSNWLTKCVARPEDHPIARLHEAGVSLSINSDDPHLMAIDLVHEYQVCAKYHGMSIEDFDKINRQTLDWSFLDQEEREYVRKEHFL